MALLLLVALAVLWLGVASPALGWYADRADLVQRQQARAASVTATIPALQRQAAEAGAGARPALLAQ